MRAVARPMLRVGKNTLARFSAQVWTKLLSLIMVALIARYRDAAGVGRYVLVLTVAGIFGALSDAGLNIFLTREAARDTDLERQRELLGVALPLKAALAVAGYAGLVLAATLIPFPEATKRLIPLGGLILVPNAATGAMAAIINGRQRMEVTGFLSMVVQIVAAAGAFLALGTGHDVASVLGWTVGAGLLGAALHAAILWRWRLLPRLRWDPKACLACLSESFPFALTAIMAMAYTRMGLVLLSLWGGEEVTGWYGAAYKLWEAVGLLPASLLDAMFPEMSRLAKGRQGLRRLNALFHTSGWAMLVGGVLLAAGGALGARELILLVYGRGEHYTSTILAFRLLVWAIPATFLYLLGGHTLYALGKQRRVTGGMAIAGLVNVGLNVALIPRWGGLGTGAVALFSEWLLLILLYPQARRTLGKRLEP